MNLVNPCSDFDRDDNTINIVVVLNYSYYQYYQLAAAAAGRFAAKHPAGRRYQSIAAGAGTMYQLQPCSAANASQ